MVTGRIETVLASMTKNTNDKDDFNFVVLVENQLMICIRLHNDNQEHAGLMENLEVS